MLKYPSVEQFRNVVKDVSEYTKRKHGLRDENGDLILAQPKTWTNPKLKFTGTCKLHGTNASIRYNVKNDEIIYQSRNRTLNIQNDNAGFALWASQHDWKEMIPDDLLDDENVSDVVIFGEWCGGNIQKGVAITGLPNMFVIFEIVTYDKEGKPTYHCDINVEDMKFYYDIGDLNSKSIYFITQFPTYEIEIDFEHPELSQNKLVEITEAVENECPVGKYFGVSGIGEGVVYHCDISPKTRLRFKVKGDRHAGEVQFLRGLNVSQEIGNDIKSQLRVRGLTSCQYHFS